MARPRKQIVDYFPHNCTHKKTMFIIEQRWGNDGYAFWFKLLEMLGSAPGHYLLFKNTEDWEFLQAKTKLKIGKCKSILNLLSLLNAIDTRLWQDDRVVYSDNFVENVKDAYRNRVEDIPVKPDFLRKKLNSNKVSNVIKPLVSDVRNSHTKEKETKEEEKKEDSLSKPKKVFDIKSVEYRCSKYLFKKIRENNPKAKKPNFQVWAKNVDLMLRVDKRNIHDIKKIIDWCQQDSFWHTNILSTAKLRIQFDQLTLNEKAKKEEGYIIRAKKCYKDYIGGACRDNADLDSKKCKYCYGNLKK